MNHAHNFKNIEGERYGYLTAIKSVGIKERYSKKSQRILKQAVWLFRCDCGNQIEKPRATFEAYKRQGLTISCGCKSYINKLGNKHAHWKGYGELPSTYFSYLKRSAEKRGRRKRNIPFHVSIEYLWNLFLKQNRKCAFTGELLCFGTLAQVKNKELREPLASLDRIDSSKGYVEGNIQWVHKKINVMKQDLTDDDFIMWCKKVSLHHA